MLKALLEKVATRRGKPITSEEIDAFFAHFFSDALFTKSSLQESCEIPEQEMREFYALAYVHYQRQELVEAEEHFRLLVLLNPLRESYWMGYSATLQLRRDLERALHGYAMVAILNRENPFCHFHAHECYLALKKEEEAKKALTLAYELCGGKREYRTLKAFCKSIADKQFVR